MQTPLAFILSLKNKQNDIFLIKNTKLTIWFNLKKFSNLVK